MVTNGEYNYPFLVTDEWIIDLEVDNEQWWFIVILIHHTQIKMAT